MTRADASSIYEYTDMLGSLAVKTRKKHDTVTDFVSFEQFDGLGRKTKSISGAGIGAIERRTTRPTSPNRPTRQESSST